MEAQNILDSGADWIISTKKYQPIPKTSDNGTALLSFSVFKKTEKATTEVITLVESGMHSLL